MWNECICLFCTWSSSLHEHLRHMHKNMESSCLINMLKCYTASAAGGGGETGVKRPPFGLYQCVNCRLFFASKCNFAHNCWTNASANGSAGANKNDEAISNYFSPIYTHIDLSAMFDSRLNYTRQQQQLQQQQQQQQQHQTINAHSK